MTETPTWPAMTGFADGQNVDAATLNAPIQQLASRTDLLWRLLAQNDRTKVAIDVEISGDTPAVGQPVYRVGDDGTFAKAIGAVGNNAWFYADSQAMAVGVVSAISGPTATTATVVLCGYLALPDNGVDVGNLIDDPSPVSGRYYLSNYNAGKLTANPSGPVIYVCDCYIDGGKVKSMLVNPQYRDTGESHVHRSFVLSGKPMGGYAIKGIGLWSATDIMPVGEQLREFDSTSSPLSSHIASVVNMIVLRVFGAWNSDDEVTYTFTLGRYSGTTAADELSDWDNYYMEWTSTAADEQLIPESARRISLSPFKKGKYSNSSTVSVGLRGMLVQANIRGKATIDAAGHITSSEMGDLTPADIPSTATWTVVMPDAGRAWITEGTGTTDDSPRQFMLNLGMYPALARYVPPVPANGAALVVDGLEFRDYMFGANRQWYITGANANGGPWLHWTDGKVSSGNSVTTPFKWLSHSEACAERSIVLHLNHMRVGPTGFVTSLQPAPGSPLKVTSALTDTDAVQGALQIGLDINFKSSAGNVAGSQVVKRINGSTFETGPVVERIIAGPGMTVSQEQGIVRVSASNAVYAGDFETIALKNAKQDLAGGVFPYTKLIGPDITSGFTAKFRVPDHIPYGKYNVIVSASVFGEAAVPSTASQAAAFSLLNYILPDQACSSSVDPEEVFNGSISSPIKGYRGDSAKIAVAFPAGYVAYNPVLLHGFSTDSGAVALANIEGQRKSEPLMCLKDEYNKAIEVYPGYFVGIEIQRCAPGGTLTPYTNPIGFLSLRWNLVEV